MFRVEKNSLNMVVIKFSQLNTVASKLLLILNYRRKLETTVLEFLGD